jgi:hypothetical protein
MEMVSSQIHACRSSLKMLQSVHLLTMQTYNSQNEWTRRSPRLHLQKIASVVRSPSVPRHLQGPRFCTGGAWLLVDLVFHILFHMYHQPTDIVHHKSHQVLDVLFHIYNFFY